MLTWRAGGGRYWCGLGWAGGRADGCRCGVVGGVVDDGGDGGGPAGVLPRVASGLAGCGQGGDGCSLVCGDQVQVAGVVVAFPAAGGAVGAWAVTRARRQAIA